MVDMVESESGWVAVAVLAEWLRIKINKGCLTLSVAVPTTDHWVGDWVFLYTRLARPVVQERTCVVHVACFCGA